MYAAIVKDKKASEPTSPPPASSFDHHTYGNIPTRHRQNGDARFPSIPPSPTAAAAAASHFHEPPIYSNLDQLKLNQQSVSNEGLIYTSLSFENTPHRQQQQQPTHQSIPGMYACLSLLLFRTHAPSRTCLTTHPPRRAVVRMQTAYSEVVIPPPQSHP